MGWTMIAGAWVACRDLVIAGGSLVNALAVVNRLISFVVFTGTIVN